MAEERLSGNDGILSDRFLIPPFSVLDSSLHRWQARKRLWHDLGIDSGRGRKAILTYNVRGSARDPVSQRMRDTGSTSVFDPVLAEISYRWFTPNNGVILDPFSGGSVRGFVAAKTGRSYVGVDIRPEQVRENDEQIAASRLDGVRYVVGDSSQLDVLLPPGDTFDFLFSCPPYGDLEVYSDNPNDLSTMKPEAFLNAYREVIRSSVARLRDDRFAAFLVGNYRDNAGNLVDFTGQTVRAFEDAGCKLYNQFVFVTPINTLSLRAGGQFALSRKAGLRHQSLVVFIKGNARKAVEALGPIDVTHPGGVFNNDNSNILELFTES
jgi:16S rRNA G966 N2-methylase RsmD